MNEVKEKKLLDVITELKEIANANNLIIDSITLSNEWLPLEDEPFKVKGDGISFNGIKISNRIL